MTWATEADYLWETSQQKGQATVYLKNTKKYRIRVLEQSAVDWWDKI